MNSHAQQAVPKGSGQNELRCPHSASASILVVSQDSPTIVSDIRTSRSPRRSAGGSRSVYRRGRGAPTARRVGSGGDLADRDRVSLHRLVAETVSDPDRPTIGRVERDASRVESPGGRVVPRPDET